MNGETFRTETRVDTIIFDFDGTLADTGTAIERAFSGTLDEMEIVLPADTSVSALSCHTLGVMFRKAGIAEPARINEAIDRYSRRYRALSPEISRLYPGVAETLRRLSGQGISLAIATNERRNNLDVLLPALGIAGYFAMSLCEDEVRETKPAPEMLRRIMDRLGTQPWRTLMAGDSHLDIRMGKAAGCMTCGVAYGTRSADALRAQHPTGMVHRFADLTRFLRPDAAGCGPSGRGR